MHQNLYEEILKTLNDAPSCFSVNREQTDNYNLVSEAPVNKDEAEKLEHYRKMRFSEIFAERINALKI